MEETLNAMPDAEADRLCMHFPGSFGGGRPFKGDLIGRRLNQKKRGAVRLPLFYRIAFRRRLERNLRPEYHAAPA